MNWVDMIDLGADRVRMKDPRDAKRQHRTVEHLLYRFNTQKAAERYELQVLADEVGMGKTFVALATAFATLETQRTAADRKTSSHVLVLVPNNDALYRKWQRETQEFVKRCVRAEHQAAVARRFRLQPAERLDELAAGLCSVRGPEVVLAKVSALGGKVKHFDLKARYVLATAFRVWAFRLAARERLLRGSGKWEWPTNPKAFSDFDDGELSRIPLNLDRLTKALERVLRGPGGEKLRDLCRECAKPHRRKREADLHDIRRHAVELYKQAVMGRVKRDIPLVIVDEAHNWKNGPTKGSNNYRDFERWIAPKARRLLFLTATPFQLRPEELVELLKASDKMGIEQQRTETLRLFREQDIDAVLKESSHASRAFAESWARLPLRVTGEQVLRVWNSAPLVAAKQHLRAIADEHGAMDASRVDPTVDETVREVEPVLREFFKQALRLYAFNRDLSQELGKLVVRHRRRTEHRLVRVGNEVTMAPASVSQRPDARVLHAGAGIDVRGAGELPHYLLMRATSELKQGKGRAALGSSLTGCYSTLFKSAESSRFGEADGRARQYIETLQSLVGTEEADAEHPKVATLVRDTVERWERGEKTLVFAFRVHTAKRLQQLVRQEIEKRIEQRKAEVLGGDEGLRSLRQRMTSRNRDLIPIVLDRVLWSSLWAPPGGKPVFGPDDLEPQREDYEEVARLALQFGVDVSGKTVDRVFLQRAVECAQARRLIEMTRRGTPYRKLLEAVADESWVARPYGGITADADDDAVGLVDERGVHTEYPINGSPGGAAVHSLAEDLVQRDAAARRSKQRSVLRSAFDGPSLWLGEEPMEVLLQHWHFRSAEEDLRDERLFHEQLRALTWSDGDLDFRTRALAFLAVRRAALRESLLVRLLPSASDLEDHQWGKLLVQRIGRPLHLGGESVLRRLAVFLEDLASATGSIDKADHARGALYDATRARGQTGIEFIRGGDDANKRNRAFVGFNTPLLPEVLVCTSVGQEGIDLHRHCRHVVHYDLAWNPATLEQRTGRIDRIGCLALRERELDQRKEQQSRSFLEVDVPYLAGTYDERMFEELRLRAQTFEVLTGGELAADNAEGQHDNKDDEGEERGVNLLTLPAEIVADLRVDLEVWREHGT